MLWWVKIKFIQAVSNLGSTLILLKSLNLLIFKNFIRVEERLQIFEIITQNISIDIESSVSLINSVILPVNIFKIETFKFQLAANRSCMVFSECKIRISGTPQ